MVKRRVIEELPLFPLTGIVLMPGTFLPLNVFEQRYRNLVSDVLDKGGRIGVIQPRVPALDNFGPVGGENPDVYAIGCVGRMSDWKREDDGRFRIVLEGSERFEVEEELSLHRGYRRARARLLGEERDSLSPEVVEGVLAAALEFSSRKRIAADPDVLAALPGWRLVNVLVAALPFEPAERQLLLETSGAENRAGVLLQLFAMSAPENGFSTGTDEVLAPWDSRPPS